MSKGGEEEQFLERKTRTSSSEETGGLDQPDGSEEGPLIDRQGVQAEELGDCLGARQSQHGAVEVLTAQSLEAFGERARRAAGSIA